MKHASSKTSKERRVAERRGLILMASCLVVIFSAVLAMNLERPSLASKTSRLDEIKSPVEAESRLSRCARTFPRVIPREWAAHN